MRAMNGRILTLNRLLLWSGKDLEVPNWQTIIQQSVLEVSLIGLKSSHLSIKELHILLELIDHSKTDSSSNEVVSSINNQILPWQGTLILNFNSRRRLRRMRGVRRGWDPTFQVAKNGEAAEVVLVRSFHEQFRANNRIFAESEVFGAIIIMTQSLSVAAVVASEILCIAREV
jgi:hypothetical protein